MNTAIPTAPRRRMPKALINLMKKSDTIHSESILNPETDYVMYDHVYDRKEYFGQIKKLVNVDTELKQECVTEFLLRKRSLNLTNEAKIHFITNYDQTIDQTIKELDHVLKCYTNEDKDLLLVYAKSYIRPIKDVRFKALLDSGEITTNSVNLKVEEVNIRFPHKY